jgi:beta-xylosidase
MIEAVMLWNEPNNLSHWDFEIDPGWTTFAKMLRVAADAVRIEGPHLKRVLGGISPIDPEFVKNLDEQGALEHIDVVAVHGFPLDWQNWQIDDWPVKIAEIQAVTNLPVWITEVGVSTFGAEEVQEFGLKRTASLLRGHKGRVHWHSLFDLPKALPATTRFRDAESSSYCRQFYMGLLKEDGTPKLAARTFAEHALGFGICQWLHFEDPRLDHVVAWLKKLGVKHLRTGLSWADSLRPNADAWFDKQMKALEPFDVTLTFCFTPEVFGVRAHHASPPRDVAAFSEFCARMTRRYG